MELKTSCIRWYHNKLVAGLFVVILDRQGGGDPFFLINIECLGAEREDLAISSCFYRL